MRSSATNSSFPSAKVFRTSRNTIFACIVVDAVIGAPAIR
jgi:hypothetical protein